MAHGHVLRLLIPLALLVAACGGNDAETVGGSEPAPPTSSSAASSAPRADAFPVTVEHEYGSTTIEARPERIVTVGLVEQDALLALGVVPVATTEWFGDHPGAVWPWAQDELEALGGEAPTALDATDGIDLEAVAAQRPDLVIALWADLTPEEYEQLSAIAPTVAQPAEYIGYGMPWQELTRAVGRIVGKAGEADALVASVEERFAEARAAHPEFAGASAVVATPYEGIFVYGPGDARGVLLAELGFEVPEAIVDVTGEEYGGTLSAERADLLDTDVIVWLDPSDEAGPLGGPLYSTFPVHTEGREVFLDSFGTDIGGATSFVTVLSLPFLLDELVPRLALAIDGDATTEVPTEVDYP